MSEYTHLTEKLANLTLGTAYSITQKNGQRKYGPPKNWNGPPPPKGCEVFIGKLPRELFEDELIPIFSAVGLIYELRMMLNFSGSNRGYAFLNYSSRAEASAAIRLLHNYEIRPGHRIGVVRSVDNCYLHIGGIPRNKTELEVAFEMSKHVSDIVKVQLDKDFNDLNFQCALVEFDTHRAAAMARRRLVPGFVQLFGNDIEVEWAEMEQNIFKEDVLKKRTFNNNKIQEVYKTTARENDEIFMSPVFMLQEICKRYLWPQPRYNSKKYMMPEGPDMWLCRLDFHGMSSNTSSVFLSPPSPTLSEAQTSVAFKCLKYIQEQRCDNWNVSPVKSPWWHQQQTFKPLQTATW